jgi:hypothetical protein
MVAAISSLSTLAKNKYGKLIECSLGLQTQLHEQTFLNFSTGTTIR